MKHLGSEGNELIPDAISLVNVVIFVIAAKNQKWLSMVSSKGQVTINKDNEGPVI